MTHLAADERSGCSKGATVSETQRVIPGSTADSERSAGSGGGAPASWKVMPLHGPQVQRLLIEWISLVAAFVLTGFVVTKWWEPSAAGAAETRLHDWLAADRSSGPATRAAELASALTNPHTKQVLLIVLLPLMLWAYRRWHDWALVTTGLLFEMTIFVVTSKLVRRERPVVGDLGQAPTFSWPSGHVAAAAVLYPGLAVVVFSHTRSTLWRCTFAAIAVAVPVAVAVARMYLGLHYLSDVVAGGILGVLSLLAVHAALVRARGGRPLSDPAA